MCGIVGYTGPREVSAILLDGLARLEYRGYDSAGIAVRVADGSIQIRKAQGKLKRLIDSMNGDTPRGVLGIGHTRWATHGAPNDINAHPHTDCTGNLALVHNGIVENFAELKSELVARGHRFESETDTEVIAHLIESELGDSQVNAVALIDATRRALKRLRGAYSVVLLDARVPNLVIGARHFSPLIVGLGEGENLLASDIPALIPHTRKTMLIEDGEVVALTPDTVRIYTLDGDAVERDPLMVTWDVQAAEKGGYPHFFIKEIHEQPSALANALRGRVAADGIHLLELDALDLERVERISILACGSSYHAGLVGKLAHEQWAGIPTEVAIASEYRYAAPVIDDKTLAILVSQSGKTADTLACFRLAREAQAQTLVVTNVVGSSLTRGAQSVLYLRVGPEIGVLATKTFSSQVVLLETLALAWAQKRGTLSGDVIRERAQELLRVPDLVEGALGSENEIRRLAEKIWESRSCFFIGRGFGFPAALEGALKLKEVSYLHAEAYAAGELKHGPIAMLDPEMPVIAIATEAATREKMVSNIQEVRARQAPVIAVASEGDAVIEKYADEVIYVPRASEPINALLAVAPLQLLSYYIALKRGCDVDMPRNLAKSVTVE